MGRGPEEEPRLPSHAGFHIDSNDAPMPSAKFSTTNQRPEFFLREGYYYSARNKIPWTKET